MISVPPYRPKDPSPEIDRAEIVALRMLVMALIAASANEYERSGGGMAKVRMDAIADAARQAINMATVTGDADAFDRLRRRVIDHINTMFDAIRPPGVGNDAN
jgi:hypothetical protein